MSLVKGTVAQKFENRANAIPVEGWDGSRELIVMAAAFYHEWRVDQSERVAAADAEPQVVVFTGRKRFIKKPGLIEKGAPDHHGGRTHEASFEKQGKAVPFWLLVILSRIEAFAVSKPEFFSLAQLDARGFVKVSHLGRQLAGEPEVVGVEKSDVFPA